MSLFFFYHQECGTVVEDLEGQECADLAAAELYAIEVARRIMAEEVKGGELCLGCSVDIHDDQRRFLLRVPFRRAVIVTGL